MDLRDLNELRSVEELSNYGKEVAARTVELSTEHAGLPFPDEAREEYAALREAKKEIDARVTELKARADDVARLGENSAHVEKPYDFQVKRPGKTDDIYDLSTVARSFNDPSVEGRELKDRAKRAIELARFPHTKREIAQAQVEGLIERIDSADGQVARRVLLTGSPVYKEAFGNYIAGGYLTGEQSRALSLTGTSGGFAVPFELDPSIIPTSNLAINPYRAISNVKQITVDEWRGVSSAGVTAAYAAEATAATDASPTLAQPTISTEKARVFVPFSIEVGMDWGSLGAEMGALFQDAKDELEATKFTLGNGTNEPFGVITGATTVYTAAATNAIAIADIYGWEGSLGARFRPNATFVMNGGIANRIRQFDTQGGAGIWVDNLGLGLLSNEVPTPGQLQSRLLNHPAYESSAMSATMTTGQLIGVFGDFSRYYVIVDRIGMNVETIPHLFDVTNNMPTGQRGLYCYWRNGAKVVDAAAFRTLKLA
jgi:HK97 family phage major capsid protein